MPGLRVCIDVDDLDRADAFYTRALGLSAGRRQGDEWIELTGAPAPIDLLAKPPGTAALPSGTRALRDYERHWTPVHLDFVVEDVAGRPLPEAFLPAMQYQQREQQYQDELNQAAQTIKNDESQLASLQQVIQALIDRGILSVDANGNLTLRRNR